MMYVLFYRDNYWTYILVSWSTYRNVMNNKNSMWLVLMTIIIVAYDSGWRSVNYWEATFLISIILLWNNAEGNIIGI